MIQKTVTYLLIIMSLSGFTNIMNAQKTGNAKVLILIHSKSGGTYKLAKSFLKGIETIEGVNGIIKQVPDLEHPIEKNFKELPLASINELADYNGIAFGSPVYFGGVSSSMKYFLEGSIPQWTNHEWEGIPASVFMSAGSGAGKELALQSFWSTLATHGMIMVPAGIMGTENINKSIPQGNSVLGITSVAGLPSNSGRPTNDELKIAELQGAALAKQAKANAYLKKLYPTKHLPNVSKVENKTSEIQKNMDKYGIVLPDAPAPVGNYVPFKRSGNLIFINQVALNNGKIDHPGVVGEKVTEEQAKEATRQTMLNVIAVLKQATGGNLDKVKQVVQLTGIFNTPKGYTQHATLMNEASNLSAQVFGDKGVHTRATLGASSLPVDSSVEIQAVFEIE